MQEQVEVKSKGGDGRFDREPMKGVLRHKHVNTLTRLDKCCWFTRIGAGRKDGRVGHAENVPEASMANRVRTTSRGMAIAMRKGKHILQSTRVFW